MRKAMAAPCHLLQVVQHLVHMALLGQATEISTIVKISSWLRALIHPLSIGIIVPLQVLAVLDADRMELHRTTTAHGA